MHWFKFVTRLGNTLPVIWLTIFASGSLIELFQSIAFHSIDLRQHVSQIRFIIIQWWIPSTDPRWRLLGPISITIHPISSSYLPNLQRFYLSHASLIEKKWLAKNTTDSSLFWFDFKRNNDNNSPIRWFP